jgi:hypothetical protein
VFQLIVQLSVDGLIDAARLNDTTPRYIENISLATFPGAIEPSKIIRAAASAALRTLP